MAGMLLGVEADAILTHAVAAYRAASGWSLRTRLAAWPMVGSARWYIDLG